MINGGPRKFNGRQKSEQTEDRRQYDPRKYDRNMPIGITRKKIIHPNAHLSNPPRQSTFRPTFLQSCYQCGQKGHYNRNCREIFCFYRSKPGHVKKCCSIYSSYLQTKSSSSSVISQPLDTKQQKINNFEIINKKKNEE